MSAAPLFFHGSFVCRSEPLAIESCKQLQQWLQKKTSDETIVFFDFRPWPKGPCLTSDFLIKLRKIVLIFSLQRPIENVIELEKPLEFGDLRVDNWVVEEHLRATTKNIVFMDFTPKSWSKKNCIHTWGCSYHNSPREKKNFKIIYAWPNHSARPKHEGQAGKRLRNWISQHVKQKLNFKPSSLLCLIIFQDKFQERHNIRIW